MNINTYNSRIHCSILVNIMLSKKVLYCYDYMYGTFTHSELFCRLPHCCIMINDVMCDLYRPLLDIFLHRFPLHSLFLQCMQRKSSSFIHSDKRDFLVISTNICPYLLLHKGISELPLHLQ